MTIMEDELTRRTDSVLRVIHETPGLSAASIGQRLGDVPAREIRERIRRLRDRGYAVIIGEDGHGYWLLDDVQEPDRRANMVRCHRSRCREFLMDHATLMKQIGQVSAEALGERMLFDLTVPLEDAEKARRLDLGPDDLVNLPFTRRSGYFKVLCSMLDRIAQDPVAFAAERVYLADHFGSVLLTKVQAGKLAQIHKLLEEVGL